MKYLFIFHEKKIKRNHYYFIGFIYSNSIIIMKKFSKKKMFSKSFSKLMLKKFKIHVKTMNINICLFIV